VWVWYWFEYRSVRICPNFRQVYLPIGTTGANLSKNYSYLGYRHHLPFIKKVDERQAITAGVRRREIDNRNSWL